MLTTSRLIRTTAPLALLGLVVACSNSGAIGDVLGGVLGGGQQQAQAAQAQGAIRAVDTRSRQISLQLTNGQTVALAYDDQTKVVYQNQLHAVANLEPGDQVIMRVRDAGNGAYYTDSIHVTQDVNTSGAGSGATGTGGTGSANVQALQGTVGHVDHANGVFMLDVGNVVLSVLMHYGVGQPDVQRFKNLRRGDQVRFYGVFLNKSRVELVRFY